MMNQQTCNRVTVSRTKFRFLVMVAGMGFAHVASAMEPLVTDDTGTIGAGRHQIEFAATHTHETSPAGRTTQREGEVVYTHGISNSLDVYVSAGRAAGSDESAGTAFVGTTNPSLGIKWRYYEDTENAYSLLLKPELVLPVSASKEAEGLGTGRVSYGLTAGVSHETGFGSVHINWFIARDRYRDDLSFPDARTSRLSFAPVWNVGSGWTLAADTGIEHVRAGGMTTRTRFVELGAIHAINEDLELAIGFIRQRDSDQVRANTATIGLTWRFD